MQTVVFVTGVPDPDVHKTKEPISDQDFGMFQSVADMLGVQFSVVLAAPGLEWAGDTTVLMGTMGVVTFLIGLISEQIALMRFERMQ